VKLTGPEPLVFELSSPGRLGVKLPRSDVPKVEPQDVLPEDMVRRELPLPEVSELDLVRHFVHLSRRNFAIDVGFYPLGSCTMKYNPKVNEEIAALPGFSALHPEQPIETCQGALQVMYELQQALAEIGGMDEVTLEPAAGAQGELTGMLIVRAYHQSRGDTARKVVLVPDSAHGTNPATAARCGFEVRTLPSNDRGTVDVAVLKQMLGADVAGVMLTNPNTLGLFEADILEITSLVHEAGGLTYCDGANLNAILGVARPGDMGFDIMHFNLHKTFSTPHGGGGPGAGPVGVKAFLRRFLPVPVVTKHDEEFALDYNLDHSVGRVHSFYGNFAVALKAYAYIRALGPRGLECVSGGAVLNANYLLSRLKDTYPVPYGSRCMHEFVASAKKYRQRGVKAFDIAKRLLDFGFHAPTIYFPLIVEDALMIEPTETESLETLDAFVDAMIQIDREIANNPEVVTSAPHETPVSRVDEATAARRPDLKWTGD